MKKPLIFASLILAAGPTFAANEFEAGLRELATSQLQAWVQDPLVVQAIRAQNVETAGLPQSEIDRLDTQWRGETVDGALISSVLGNELSHHFRDLKEDGGGLFAEIFATDAKGLNVGQSDPTSDYWQGDEAKWKGPFLTGEIEIGDVEFDESSQAYQSQVSIPIIDPATGARIGALTVGVDVGVLSQ